MILVAPGEKSPRVVLIQILLNRAGNTLTIDGSFGALTRAAVVSFQSSQHSEIRWAYLHGLPEEWKSRELVTKFPLRNLLTSRKI
jgi:hypothetical protein